MELVNAKLQALEVQGMRYPSWHASPRRISRKETSIVRKVLTATAEEAGMGRRVEMEEEENEKEFCEVCEKLFPRVEIVWFDKSVVQHGRRVNAVCLECNTFTSFCEVCDTFCLPSDGKRIARSIRGPDGRQLYSACEGCNIRTDFCEVCENFCLPSDVTHFEISFRGPNGQ
jgi:hypothetical protein